jgi:hypothetical protein
LQWEHHIHVQPGIGTGRGGQHRARLQFHFCYSWEWHGKSHVWVHSTYFWPICWSSIACTDVLESGLFIITASVSNASPMRLRVDHRARDSGCFPAAPVEFRSIVLASGAAVNMLIRYSAVPWRAVDKFIPMFEYI